MPDAHKNFSYSTVATAPSPPTTGTSLVVTAGDGAKFPTVPFNATVWPAGAQPTIGNAEIIRVTAISTDTFTITRAQEGTAVRSIGVGDQIASTITVKTLTDIEALVPTIIYKVGSGTGDYTAPGTSVWGDVDATNLSWTGNIPVGQKAIVFSGGTAGIPSNSTIHFYIGIFDGANLLQDTLNVVGANAGDIVSWSIPPIVIVGDGVSHTLKLRFWGNGGGCIIKNSTVDTGTGPTTCTMVISLGAAN